ncbi:MAG: ATP-binding protein [Pseudomonadota bacterium]
MKENPIETWNVPQLRLGKLRLRFNDGETERRYQNMHIRQSLPIVWVSIFSGMFLYALFAILDLYIVPEQLMAIWAIRFGLVCPILFGMFLVTLTKTFWKFSQPILALGMLVPGLGVLGMVAIADAPGNHFYYAGLILVIIYCSSLSVLRYLYAAAVSVALIGLYQYVALVANPIPLETLINNNFFLGVALLVGVFTSYTQELYIRQNFVNMQLLLKEKWRSDQLLEEARASSQAKTEFLAVMSHELRTPLNAILGFSDIIKQQMFGPLGSEKYRAYIEDIHSSGSHLLSLITDILDLSKAEAGKLTLREEVVNLTEVIDRCLRMFRERAAEGGVRLHFDVPQAVTRLLADPRLLRQSLINLVSNAVKFTQRGGAVAVSVGETKDGGVLVRIEDTGIGIAKEDIPKIFEPFVQVESAYSRGHEGTGLGLPLAKKIMELHDGAVEIESELGIGTTVTLRFPAKRVAGSKDMPQRAGDAA